MENNYKVGDKVQLVSVRPNHWNINGSMDKYLNSIQTIKSIKNGFYKFEDVESQKWVFRVDSISHKIEEEKSKEELLEEAKRRYPVGTKFINPFTKKQNTVKEGHFEFFDYNNNIIVSVVEDSDCTYKYNFSSIIYNYSNKEWATIISTPTKEPIDWSKMIGKRFKALKQNAQSIPIEKDGIVEITQKGSCKIISGNRNTHAYNNWCINPNEKGLFKEVIESKISYKFEDLKGEKYFVPVDTQEKWDIVTKICGYKWNIHNLFKNFLKDSVISLKRNEHCDCFWYKEEGYIEIPYDDFLAANSYPGDSKYSLMELSQTPAIGNQQNSGLTINIPKKQKNTTEKIIISEQKGLDLNLSKNNTKVNQIKINNFSLTF